MLCAIHLDVKWLQSALIFRHHNVKTRPPGGRSNKRFWTKANLSAYLRSCSCSGKLIDSVYLLAKNGDSVPPYPASWSDPLIFSKCHNAPMHMLFLGHVKSNIDMVSKWLGRYEILTTFGKQANMYLQAVRNLRATPSGPKFLQQIFPFFLCDPRRTRRFCTRVGLAILEYHPIDEYKLQIA